MKHCKSHSLEISITKALQWLQFTRPNTTFKLFNFLSEFSFFWDFSPPSLTVLDSTVFRICILWVAEVLPAKSTVFRRLCRLQVPKRIRVDFTIRLQRPKSIVAVVKVYAAVVSFGSYALLGGIFLSCIA